MEKSKKLGKKKVSMEDLEKVVGGTDVNPEIQKVIANLNSKGNIAAIVSPVMLKALFEKDINKSLSKI